MTRAGAIEPIEPASAPNGGVATKPVRLSTFAKRRTCSMSRGRGCSFLTHCVVVGSGGWWMFLAWALTIQKGSRYLHLPSSLSLCIAARGEPCDEAS